MGRRILLWLLGAVIAVCASGCAGGLEIGETREPMDASLFSVLDEEAQSFFEGFSEASAEYMTVNYDQHYPEVTVSDQALMSEMVEALSAVRVTAKTNISSTDGYHSVCFVTADGKNYSIHFENSVMCCGQDRYILEDAEAFWKLFKATAEEYSEQTQELAPERQTA